MKIAYQALLFILALNLTTWVVQQIDVIPIAGVEPIIEPTEVPEQFNPTATVQGWGGWLTTLYIIGDIVGGLQMLWNAIYVLVVGFPSLLSNLGVPSIVVYPLYALWSFVYFIFVIEWISGRYITGE